MGENKGNFFDLINKKAGENKIAKKIGFIQKCSDEKSSNGTQNINEKKSSKNDNSKNNKQQRLIDEGFKLFTTQGIKNTSIQNIVDKANMAKGTFYLYFKDKYELRDIIIMKKSEKLFNNAIDSLQKKNITNFSDQIIFIIDHVIDELSKDKLLLQFISKDLGLGVFNKTIIDMYSYKADQSNSLKQLFLNGVEKNHIKLDNPDVTLFMIIELVSSTCVTCILNNEPLPMKEFKPILYKEIKKMIGK